jgi:hypothetical protein
VRKLRPIVSVSEIPFNERYKRYLVRSVAKPLRSEKVSIVLPVSDF